MPGFTEILIIIAILLAIIVLPKRFSKKSEPVKSHYNVDYGLILWQGIAILVSILWLAFFAYYIKPWIYGWDLYLYAGVGPAVLYWGISLLFHRFNKNKK